MAVSSSRSGRMPEIQQNKLWRDQQNEISPERTKVWTEPSSNGKFKSEQRVPVVYYLSRNGQLEHPHFMEVPLSSSQGLFLRDVISRLDVLRGIGMAALYSWSCKRSYKNGFVWHDLSENDFIYPAHGTEYVLKGSELPENTFLETVTQRRATETQIAAAEAGYHRRRRNQSCSSIDVNVHEYSVYKPESPCRSAADAATQTEDLRRRRRRPPPEIVEEKGDEIEISPPPSDSSPETLETLMKADGRLVLRADKTVNEESTASGVKADKSSVLMKLISCGSISFRDCGAGQGLISQYKMRVPRGTGGNGKVKLEEKEYFSGSIVETKKEEIPRLKRSNSYNADR